MSSFVGFVSLFGFWAAIVIVMFSSILALSKANGSRRADGRFVVEPRGLSGVLIAPFTAALLIAISSNLFAASVVAGEPAPNQFPHLVEKVGQSMFLSIVVAVAILVWFWALVASLNARRQWNRQQAGTGQ
ncbi:hypothetical protein ACNQVK_01965 [Mycobacterium sp. 134]|uniref:hypothetical protein n=1 Tax=Mycobacterium sp. 134 TaxID=3400425 RepID=UPI003AAFBEA6